jgi:lipid A 3-O-deacylase PagL
MKTVKFLLIASIISLAVTSFGQNKQSYISKKSKGVLLGFGFHNELLPENYHYRLYQFIYNYSVPLLNQQNITNHNLLVQFEPQINPVFLKHRKMEIETGINVGLIYNFRLSKNLLLDVGISSGLHFISINTALQARGFIFSDNLILGLSKRIEGEKSDWEILLQTRFRHISNMGIKEPNTGIDNFIFYMGVSKLF